MTTLDDHRIRVLKHQEKARKKKGRKARTLEVLESIAVSLKRLADSTQDGPDRG